MCAEKSMLDINASILKHIAMLKPILPMRALFFVGDYSNQIFTESFLEKNEDIIALMIEKSKGKKRNSTQKKRAYNSLEINEKVDTHYWYNVQDYLSNNAFFEQMKSKPIDKLDEAIIVASIGEGLGSVLLPELTSRFKDQNIKSVGFAILPSKLQPPDADFNALWSLATSSSKSFPQVLVGRDALESFVGVDRKGIILKGNAFLSYMLEILLSKDTFVQEFSELSKTFNLKMFTILSATGASLKVYGSLKNILDTALIRPFFEFDLSTASVLYVIVRMPFHLKEKLSRGKIELTIDDWFKEKTHLKTAYIAEPVYVDDGSDRLDIILFLGGFDLSEMVISADKKVKEIKSYSLKKGFMKEKEWQELLSSLE
jgi:hypothetical protein